MFRGSIAPSFAEWTVPEQKFLDDLQATGKGLREEEAKSRIATFGQNELAPKKKRGMLLQFLSYFVNPLIIVLIVVGIASYFLNNVFSAGIVFFMVLVSVSLTFYQEYTAQDAAEKLRKMIRNTATVVRNGARQEIALKHLVPGDLVLLSAGDLVPADCRIIACKDFFVNQASLTGESLPVEKNPAPAKEGAGVTELGNAAFFGSSVISGSAEAIVVRTGLSTQFGELSRRLSRTGTETAFDKGIREYSMLMVKFVIALVLVIFVINAVLKNDIFSSLLFALAVAVGLTPEMLPAIITANLSQGANNMAKKEVIVKHLPSIQNLGAMDVLCTDKTGTLTEDRIELVKHVNIDGEEDDRVLEFACLNSMHQTGLRNPLDGAILEHDVGNIRREVREFRKVDEIPFDFLRRRMSVVVESPEGKRMMLTKGAPESMLPLYVEHSEGKFSRQHAEKAQALYERLSSDGFRVLALASKPLKKETRAYGVADETGLVFEGFLAFLDPPKKTAHTSLQELIKRGIEVKILSGDNELVNMKIAKEVGLSVKGVITGEQIEKASDESLQVLVEKNTIFARVLPMQKERIILALQRNKHVVGYLGDGINDALALKTSDVGISVDSAVDVAKESADVILLRKSLHVLYEGVDEGRRTFSNTVKYLRMGSSSNFGNMFSVVGASIFLPFLPMTPVQILLNNFLYDMSQLGIPTDHVDSEALAKPAKWDMNGIRNFMIFIGPISSVFDYITFGLLYLVMQLPAESFHAGWFIESIITQTLVIHVIRTNKIPFLESRPSNRLLFLSLAVVGVALLIVLTPLHYYFGFGHLPEVFFPILAVMVACYLLLTQFVKKKLLERGVIS
ncbi:magnesium-translocating P-type ATPase [Candidatus Micrarchaeota archaeon CG10_big_fil_rev_8_21_14_0_10_59_7]|nr:MAG: magnesium-translocating P-type ATPase [Candidatus Micrarchaeota archaeon CG10_big_fil_rev_8_21_14_0_10_59_7]